MEKQTAVEWLVDNIHYLHSTKWNDIIQQAKEMEKEQIINAWDLGRRDIDYPANGEKYYNKTFKNN